MTMEEGRAPARRRSYPYMPNSNWRDLRRRFNANPPRGDVDAAYLAGVLGITDRAAANVVPSLRDLGLIDQAGRTTDRAMAWRDDAQYAEVVGQMIEEIYPQALRDVAPPPDPNREAAKRWFMRDLNTGEPQGERLARFYVMLASGNPNAAEEQPAGVGPRATTRRATGGTTPGRGRAGTGTARTGTAANSPALATPEGPAQTGAATRGPSLHIDIQVHIDPAATADQIDAIFASMARHLYGRE